MQGHTFKAISSETEYETNEAFVNSCFRLGVNENLRSSGMLHGVDWYLVTEGLGQTIDPIFKEHGTARYLKMGPIGSPETSVTTNLLCVKSQRS
jgi:hypothetical protein